MGGPVERLQLQRDADLGELRLDDLGQTPVLTLLIVNQREGDVAPVHELFSFGKIVRVERFSTGPIGLVLGRNDAIGGCALVEEHFFDDASPVDRLYDRLPDGPVGEVLVHEVDIDVHQRPFGHGDHNQVAVAFQARHVLGRRILHQVKVTRLEINGALGGIGDVFVDHLVQIGRTLVLDKR